MCAQRVRVRRRLTLLELVMKNTSFVTAALVFRETRQNPDLRGNIHTPNDEAKSDNE
jgi:hypothetical protein